MNIIITQQRCSSREIKILQCQSVVSDMHQFELRGKHAFNCI